MVRQAFRFTFVVALLLSLAQLALAAPGYPDIIRIGYQKGNSLVILKANGDLE